MAGFADILAQVESASSRTDELASPLRLRMELAPTLDVVATEGNAPPRGVIAAYRETIEELAPRAPAPVVARLSQEDFAARFPKMLRGARRSPDKLAALRREIAWALHPDRAGADAQENSDAMARFNAMIDAALAECRRERD
jgi:hypothetical protein